MNIEDLSAYYLGVEGGDAYFDNRARLWITHQLRYLSLQAWCFEFDWVGA